MDKQHWSEISYSARLGSIPPSVAYHSANIMGNHMVVYGGQLKLGTSVSSTQSCFNNKIYAYHLTCHKWVDMGDNYASLSVTGKCPLLSHVTLAAVLSTRSLPIFS